MLNILKTLDKEVYIAEFDELGATVCRILVPDYSEIYPVEDLIWDNTNKALDYREDILNIHSLSDDALVDLVERLEESQLDNYTDIKTLIGIEFDENTVWGQLTILELKALIYLALGAHEEAIEFVEEVSFQAPKYSKKVGDRMLLTVNAFNRNEHIPDRYRNRKFPLKVKRGFKDIDEVEIKLPADYSLPVILV